ncbi:MAG TPA: WD40 repeat domain-containing protein [Polyangiaceae bacterium]|nr:WD40 repeat domain-containing protein [Polyangiaceae bacterium]
MPGLTDAGAAPPAKTELRPRWRLDAGDYVAAAALSRDGARAAIGTGGAGALLVVDAETGREAFRADAHPGGVLALGWAPDGELVATGGQGERAKVWHASGELWRELPGGGPWVEHVAWAPAGDRLATASGRFVRVWGRGGEPLVEAGPLASTVTGLAWRGDGAALAASCYGGVHIWSFAQGAAPRHLPWQGSLISLAWSPDGKVIACGSQDCSVHFWRLATGRDSEMTGYPFKPRALAWDARSSLLATAGDATVTVWDFSGKGPERSRPLQLAAHSGVCTRLAFGPSRAVLASGSQDTSVLVWEPRRGPKPVRFAFLEDEVTALAWHPAHRGLLGADAAGNAIYWDVALGGA